MEEKYMVNDILSQVKSSLTTYQNTITECENPQLRQTIQDIRNNCENFQYDLFKVATQKGYYKPAEQAKQDEVNTVKNQFQA